MTWDEYVAECEKWASEIAQGIAQAQAEAPKSGPGHFGSEEPW